MSEDKSCGTVEVTTGVMRWVNAKGEEVFRGTQWDLLRVYMDQKETIEYLSKGLMSVQAQRDALRNRLQWSNIGTGQAYLLQGVEQGGIGKMLQEAVDEVKGKEE